MRQALRALPPRTVRALLHDLAGLRRRADDGEDLAIPLASLHLKSGRDVGGGVLALGGDGRDSRNAVIFHLHDPQSHRLSTDVVYLDLDDIEAVTLHDVTAAVHLLARNWTAPPPSTSVPTRLELRRRAETFAARVREESGLTLPFVAEVGGAPTGGEALYWLGEAMSEVTGTLVELLRDDMARETLGKALQGVRFVLNRTPGVLLDATTLIVRVAADRGRDGYLSGRALRTAIEDLF